MDPFAIDQSQFIGKKGVMGYRNRMRYHRAKKTAAKIAALAKELASKKEI